MCLVSLFYAHSFAGLDQVSQVHSEFEGENLIISWTDPGNMNPNSSLQYNVSVINEHSNKTALVNGTSTSFSLSIGCECEQELCMCKNNFRIIIVPWSPVTNIIENSVVEKGKKILYNIKCKDKLHIFS